MTAVTLTCLVAMLLGLVPSVALKLTVRVRMLGSSLEFA